MHRPHAKVGVFLLFKIKRQKYVTEYHVGVPRLPFSLPSNEWLMENNALSSWLFLLNHYSHKWEQVFAVGKWCPIYKLENDAGCPGLDSFVMLVYATVCVFKLPDKLKPQLEYQCFNIYWVRRKCCRRIRHFHTNIPNLTRFPSFFLPLLFPP